MCPSTRPYLHATLPSLTRPKLYMLESITGVSAPGDRVFAGTRPLRVLHVIAPSAVGGLERVVCTLARAQRDASMAVRVAAIVEPTVRDHPVVEELLQSGVGVDVVRVTPRSYLVERRAIAAICTQWRPDLVHTHGYRTDLVDSPVAARLSIPRVSTFHGFTGGDARNRLYEWMERRAGRTMDAVIAVSRPLREQLAASGISSQQLHLVPNAHERRGDFLDRATAREALGLPAEGVIVGWLGRLTKEKGPDVFVDAMRLLRGEDIAAAVIGEGRERASLEQRARDQAKVSFHGLIANAGRYLPAFDVFVLSSRTEGTPMVLFEAMDAGVPVVATRVGGVPEVVRAVDALLVDAERPSAVADAIRGVIRDRHAARLRVESARRRLVAEYGSHKWVEQYEAVYRQVIRPTTT